MNKNIAFALIHDSLRFLIKFSFELFKKLYLYLLNRKVFCQEKYI